MQSFRLKKESPSTAWPALIEHVCQVAESYLHKTAWTLKMLNKFGAVYFNKPVAKI